MVVMPAYNAARTVKQTYDEIRDQQIVDHIILVDDRSRDDTVAIARQLEGVQLQVHDVNRGYGGNQKTCYRLALEAGADIVIMIHPDYQYTPKLIPAMVSIIANEVHPCVLGSRILGGYAMHGGMPTWKYIANRWLTLVENILLGQSSPSITRATGLFRGRFWRPCRCRRTQMTSFLITRCWRRFSGVDSRLAS